MRDKYILLTVFMVAGVFAIIYILMMMVKVWIRNDWTAKIRAFFKLKPRMDEPPKPVVDINPDKAAYPMYFPNIGYSTGFSKREVFVMAAMQGLCAAPNCSVENTTRLAIQIADKTLVELAKVKE